MSFQGNRCGDCDVTFFPPRALCERCGRTRLIDCELQAESVVSSTEVSRGPGELHDTPVRIELVRLSNSSLAIHRE